MNPTSGFVDRGWEVFDQDDDLISWTQSIKETALVAAQDPTHAHWCRHQRTWFVGVNALPNDAEGAVNDGPPLLCRALSFAQQIYGLLPLDLAQVSIAYPGYPKQDRGETDAAHGFRKNRDAAHVDGLKSIGPEKRRKLDEPHAFILGVPLSNSTDAPLVVWDKSHQIIGKAFRHALGGITPDEWSSIDLTDTYQKARKQVFDTCRRIELPVVEGQATLLHRFTLHGVAPWANAASDFSQRAIVYFRPTFPEGSDRYLELP